MKDILLRQKEMLEEMSKSFSKTDNNEILHEQSGMPKK